MISCPSVVTWRWSPKHTRFHGINQKETCTELIPKEELLFQGPYTWSSALLLLPKFSSDAVFQLVTKRIFDWLACFLKQKHSSLGLVTTWTPGVLHLLSNHHVALLHTIQLTRNQQFRVSELHKQSRIHVMSKRCTDKTRVSLRPQPTGTQEFRPNVLPTVRPTTS